MGDNENRKVYKARQVKNYREMVEYSCKNYAQNIAYKYKKDYTAKNVEYIEKTYEQVGKDIKAFGTGLLNLDLMGERIVVVGKNRYEWCISYLATTCSNMVIVPIDKALPDIEMQRLIERSEAKAIIFDEKYLETIKKVQEKENSNLKTLICMDNIQEKGIKTLIQTAKRLPDIQIKIAGNGGLVLNDIPHNVELLGFKSGKDLEKTISESSFIIVPSEWYETFGLSAAEAMALSKPVIASNIGGLPEIVENGITGYLFNYGNTESLYQTIQTAINIDDCSYYQMCNNAYNFIRKFSEEKYINNIIELYQNNLKKK